MPQLLDLADEILLEVVALVPFDPVHGSHPNLCLTNRRLHSIMCDNRLPSKIAEQQFPIQHYLEKSQKDAEVRESYTIAQREATGLVKIQIKGFLVYPKYLWYNHEQVQKWQTLLKSSGYFDNAVMNIGTGVIAYVSKLRSKFSSWPTDARGVPQTLERKVKSWLFYSRVCRNLPVEVLKMLRYLMMHSATLLGYPWHVDDFNSSRVGTSADWISSRPVQPPSILTAMVADFRGVHYAPVADGSIDDMLTSHYIEPATRSVFNGLWNFFRTSTDPTLVRRTIMLCFSTQRTLCEHFQIEELKAHEHEHTQKAGVSATYPPLDRFLRRETKCMNAINLHLNQLFQDHVQVEALLKQLDLEAIGRTIYITFQEVDAISDDMVENEVVKEYARLGIDDWLRHG